MDNLPFVFGTVSTGDNFIGREREIEMLSQNFTNRVNTIIMSPRRIGKTSLVAKVSDIVSKQKDMKVVYMDIFACKDSASFYETFATELIRQTESTAKRLAGAAVDFLSGIRPQINVGPDPATNFSISFDVRKDESVSDEVLKLPETIAKKKQIRLVVCIDEFQQIAEFEDAVTFQKKLRSVWQHNDRVSYCLFGSKRHMMRDIFADKGKPFYRFGQIMPLGPILTEDWVTYIVGQFSKTGKSISEELARSICEYVDNTSGYVQQLAWITWTMTKDVANKEILSAAKEQLLNENAPLFEFLIDGLSTTQFNFLTAMANGMSDGFMKQETLEKYRLGTAGNVTSVKRTLERKDIIFSSGRTLAFTDPVMKHWLMKAVHGALK